MDIFDQAQAVDEQLREAALSARQASQTREPGTMECIDCGDEIPTLRRQAMPSCRRCIDCQNDYEKWKTR